MNSSLYVFSLFRYFVRLYTVSLPAYQSHSDELVPSLSKTSSQGKFVLQYKYMEESSPMLLNYLVYIKKSMHNI